MRRLVAPTLVILCACALAVLAEASHQQPLNGCTSRTVPTGTLTSPSFSLAGATSPALLNFDSWFEIESNIPSQDQVVVESSIDGGTTWQVLEDLTPPLSETGRAAHIPHSNAGLNTPPVWENKEISLASLTGAADVRIRFRFAHVNGDNLFQGFRGWTVDDVQVAGAAAPFSFDFENGLPSGWVPTGFWHVQQNPETIAVAPGINPELVTLPDSGNLLPDAQIGHSSVAWFGEAATGTYCGADFAFGIALSPPFDSRTLGESQTLTVASEGGSSGTVRFAVSGANTGGGTVGLEANGTASFSYAGTTPGDDSVFAFLDENSSGTFDFGEPSASAFVSWAAPPAQAPAPPQPTLSLLPTTASLTAGQTHTLTATAQNASGPVRFSVTGANPGSGATATDAAGNAAFSYVGLNPGGDSITAFLDVNSNGTQDAGEPGAAASANWAPAQQRPRDAFPAGIETAATLDQLSDPEPFREINVAADEGAVFVRLPGGRGGAARASQAGTPTGFIPLTQAAQVPVGSIVEASRGRMSLESTADARGLRTQRAQFFDGRFQVRQPRSRRPVTEMVLKGGSFRGCPRAGKSSAPGADASQRRRQGRRVRRVWGNGRGNFRTRGRYSSATVRGTTWLTEDRCGGTLTRVARRPRTNRVVVQDFVTRRSRLLRAGQSYFAARPLGRR